VDAPLLGPLRGLTLPKSIENRFFRSTGTNNTTLADIMINPTTPHVHSNRSVPDEPEQPGFFGSTLLSPHRFPAQAKGER
jgi:hypothetical protein